MSKEMEIDTANKLEQYVWTWDGMENKTGGIDIDYKGEWVRFEDVLTLVKEIQHAQSI